MSQQLDALRSHPGFPGTIISVFEAIEARITALEASAERHSPLLEKMHEKWEELKAEAAAGQKPAEPAAESKPEENKG